MTKAQNIVARAATIAVMALCVIWLTGLFTAPQPATPRDNVEAEAQKPAAAQPVATLTNTWSGEVNYAPAYAALNPYAEIAATASSSAFDPGDDYWGLPRSDGVETVSAYCSACHTLQIVMQQRQSRDGWDYLLNWMAEKQGMAEPPPDMRAEILDYLSREFGE